jgi:putative heme degradation protein
MTLHLGDSEAEQSWVVELPSAGTPPTVEFFGPTGDHLISLTVQPGADSQHVKTWREIVEALVSTTW